jgi:hypothetical protein
MTVVALYVPKFSLNFVFNFDLHVTFSWPTELPLIGLHTIVVTMGVVVIQYALQIARWSYIARLMSDSPVSASATTEWPCDGQDSSVCRKDIDIVKKANPGQFGLAHGDKVKARCKGSRRHYPGKIHRDNKNGTYCVKFGAFKNRLHYFAAPAIHLLGQWTLWPLVKTVTLLRKVDSISLYRKGCFVEEEASDENILKAVTVGSSRLCSACSSDSV